MLEEFFYFLGVDTIGRGARMLGYRHEVAALQARHRHCRAAWQPHLQATRAALLKAADRDTTAGGTALLVGGGIAGDQPIEELLARFERIVLLDIAFAYPTRRLAARWPGRVFCHLHDVTGVVDWLARRRMLPPPSLLVEPHLPDLPFKPSWVASINCLSQLPLLPIDWLHDHGIGQHLLEQFGRALIHAHLNWLEAWQSPLCLITEIEDRTFDRHGVMLEQIDYRPLLRPFLESATLLDSWTWHLRPNGELPGGGGETRLVEAYRKSGVKSACDQTG